MLAGQEQMRRRRAPLFFVPSFFLLFTVNASWSQNDSRLEPLPGVSINFTTTRTTWTTAETANGLQIEYVVSIAEDVEAVHPETQDAGWCGDPGPSGLILFEDLRGNGQRYCLCDYGLCLEEPVEFRTLPKGTYPGTFYWEGRNWTGSSDTMRPKGDAFPPGRYTLTVSAIGLRRVANQEKYFKVVGSYVFDLVQSEDPPDDKPKDPRDPFRPDRDMR